MLVYDAIANADWTNGARDIHVATALEDTLDTVCTVPGIAADKHSRRRKTHVVWSTTAPDDGPD